MEGPSFYNPSWDSSMDQGDPFESALTSIVSSPVAAPSNLLESDNNYMIRELIGRLGSICNSRDSASLAGDCSIPNSAANSCYSTPLNSPPKLGLSMMERNSRSSGGIGYPGRHSPLPSDSGFVERAERFSCFGGRNVIGGQGLQGGFAELPLRQFERTDSARISRVLSSPKVGARPRNGNGNGNGNGNSPENVEMGNSPEGSSISEQVPRPIEANSSRKRKFLPRGKAKESPGTSSAKDTEACAENERPSEKKSKDHNVRPQEPLKDYIHVRARRGQATDSHSLAERVRREKISQRMKVLQDLVPGCNKVTGKAVMLDEIINYVQSLQCQVEFLSMKLSTLNPRTDFNVEALVSKEMCNPHGSSLFQGDSSSSAFPYGYHPHQALQLQGSNTENPFPFNALNVAVHPSLDGFCEASSTATAVSGLWDDELHSVVQMQMGLPPNQPPQRSQAAAAGQMKIES